MRFPQLYNLIESFLKSLPKTKNIFDYNAYLYFHDKCIGSHIIFNICITYTSNFLGRFLLFLLGLITKLASYFWGERPVFHPTPTQGVFCSPPRGKDQNSESESPFLVIELSDYRTLAYRTYIFGGYRIIGLSIIGSLA